MKHLWKLGGLTKDEILHVLDVADEYKRLHKQGVDPKDLQGKAVALMFAKHSTRTRTSLEVGIYQMGGLGTYLSAIRSASSVYPVKSRWRRSVSRSMPMLTHTSVKSTSASRAASSGSCTSRKASP